ncbi:MAG: hypothetical protein CL678_17005 [Bdellovibrionaceae bacterium]|nr:hypothetical protein [Pseudobdellovibrionaceae bacterium]|tara:strand:+ start:1273 stop:3132 length:1860 start_codon:yes stop_codon:yes gene_type:complete
MKWLNFFLLFLINCAPLSPPPLGLSENDQARYQNRSLETIALLGINDLHGEMDSTSYESSDWNSKKKFSVGGLANLQGYFKILRDRFGSRFVPLNAGDHWKGTLLSELDHGKTITSLFNDLEFKASALSQTDLELPLSKLKLHSKEAKFPWLISNLKKNSAEFSQAALFSAGGLQIGVIGLTLPRNPINAPIALEVETQLEQLKITIENLASNLRDKGADLIVLLSHGDIRCRPPQHYRNSNQYNVWKESDLQSDCRPDSMLGKLIFSLKKDTVQAIISGGNHQLIHHWIEGIPVIQSGHSGRFFNLIYLTVDKETRRVIPDLTRIEGPIPVCPKIFENQSNCNGWTPAPAQGRGNLIPPLFYGHTVNPSEQMRQKIEQLKNKTAEKRTQYIADAERTIHHSRISESELGNLVSDAMRDATDADFALFYPGGIRAEIPQGKITEEVLFKSLPFDQKLVLVEVSGKHLKTIIQVAQSGARGTYPISGLQLKISGPDRHASSKDLNHNHKIEHWEIDRLRKIRFPNGKRIQNRKKYKLVTVDYLIHGGDDLKWAFSQIPRNQIKFLELSVREAVSNYLKKKSKINTYERPLIDPKHPRIRGAVHWNPTLLHRSPAKISHSK